MVENKDLDRLRKEYENRKLRIRDNDLYSFFYTPYLFAEQQKRRVLLHALRKNNINSFEGKRILEIGCGSGRVLLEFLSLGASPDKLYGIDLLFDRLIEARSKLPASGIQCSDGQSLPFPDQAFDLVMQYTAFSSVLDIGIKERMALEMLRVINNKGIIIWYDFWINPTNIQTKGILPKEIKILFPQCDLTYYKTTLAPPIARRIASISWIFAQFLESLKIFNSHYFVIIQKTNRDHP